MHQVEEHRPEGLSIRSLPGLTDACQLRTATLAFEVGPEASVD